MENNKIECLVHHGILGQKWGIRRYRNKNGTLTIAGKKREAKLKAERDRLAKNKTEESKELTKSSSSSGKSLGVNSKNEVKKEITLEDVSTEELQNIVTRMNLENRYNELTKQQNDPNRDLKLAKEKLELERDYKKLYKELHPEKENLAKQYVKKLGSALADQAANTVADQGKKIIDN